MKLPLWRRRQKEELEEELHAHLETAIRERMERGESRAQAEAAAQREFGNVNLVRETTRDMWGWASLEVLLQDVRYGLRQLRNNPSFMAVVLLTVGLGIGGTTAIFSAIYAVLLRPLPYADPGQLVRIYTDAPPNKFHFSVADYLALQAQQTHFEQIAGYTNRAMAFSDGNTAEQLRGRAVSWTYFALLGLTPAIGRDFTEQDSQPGSPPAVIVSHGFWQQRLSGRLDAIGKPIRLDGADYTVAGVLPQSVGPLEQRQEFFVAAQWKPPERKGPFFITVLGRVRRGAQRTAAEELRAINRRIFLLWKVSYQDEKATWSMMDLKSHITGDVGAISGLALAAVGLVWLIACTNASNLLIARVTNRRRELALRVALGASRGRVVRHLLTESGLLALGSAVVGIAVASFSVGFMRDFGAGYFPRTHEIALDGPVLWLLAAVTVASALLFGLIPAVHGTGGSVEKSLRSMGRTTTGSVGVRHLRQILVGSQFAIATPLLVVAGLLAASLNELQRVDLGFDGQNLVSGGILLPTTQYEKPGQVASFWDELRERVEALPGVTGVAFADGRPPNDVAQHNNFDLEDSPTPSGESQPVTPWVAVTPEYFRLLGLSLLEGRLFDERDGQGTNVEVVVVDQAWAKRFFPNQSALGKRFREGGCTTCPWTVVVGVVSTVKYSGLEKPEEGSVYWPLAGRGAQDPSRFRYLLVRTSGNTSSALPAIQQAVRQIDPSLPFSNVATISELVSRSLQRPRSLTLLVVGFATVALLLSVVGIYGVMAYYVQQHLKDISIRLALGGTPASVLGMVVGQGMKVVAAGVAVGLLAALALTQLMSSLLFGVGAGDAFTFVSVSIILSVVALAACFLPARRASLADPMVALRYE